MKFIFFVFPIIALIGCICEPPPESKHLHSLNSTWYVNKYDTFYNLHFLLESNYRSQKQEKKQFGCIGYHKILGFYYADSLITKSVVLKCVEDIGYVKSQENWITHPNTFIKILNNHSMPINAISINMAVGKYQYSQLPDSALFRLQYQSSAPATFNDSFFVKFVK